jgi:putative ubiquitin-RnfH superfamily antitoxin RatB of RatAB toxin-antitoxin module
MNITLVFSPKPREVVELKICVPTGCSAKDALDHSDWPVRYPEIMGLPTFLSVWGRNIGLDTALREGDRLEFCRALRVDPKVARRERFVGQGARGTGLFAQRRPGSKAGY